MQTIFQESGFMIIEKKEYVIGEKLKEYNKMIARVLAEGNDIELRLCNGDIKVLKVKKTLVK